MYIVQCPIMIQGYTLFTVVASNWLWVVVLAPQGRRQFLKVTCNWPTPF